MSSLPEKNTSFRNTAFVHDAAMENGEYYCRAINAVTDNEHVLCHDCPLFAGFSSDEKGEEVAQCFYFDISSGEETHLSPEEEKTRIDGLISAGLTSEFPKYLLDDEQGRRFSVIEDAICFAAEAHKGSVRKGNKLPYIIHPIETMMLTARMTNDNDVIAAAALHDVVEDTKYTEEDMRERFGDRIASLIAMESENKREGQSKESTWRIRKEESLAREKDAPREAKIIMLADKISNMRATVRDYRKNGKNIWDKFNMKDPKEQEWYYRGVAEVLSDLSNLPQYEEYLSMLREVFEGKS